MNEGTTNSIEISLQQIASSEDWSLTSLVYINIDIDISIKNAKDQKNTFE